MSLELTTENFEEITNGDLPVIVDFWAPWCGPCRMVGPVIEELAKEFEGKAIVAKLNVDENGEIASRFNVSSIPSILLIEKGEVKHTHVGASSKSEFTRMFEEWLTA